MAIDGTLLATLRIAAKPRSAMAVGDCKDGRFHDVRRNLFIPQSMSVKPSQRAVAHLAEARNKQSGRTPKEPVRPINALYHPARVTLCVRFLRNISFVVTKRRSRRAEDRKRVIRRSVGPTCWAIVRLRFIEPFGRQTTSIRRLTIRRHLFVFVSPSDATDIHFAGQ